MIKFIGVVLIVSGGVLLGHYFAEKTLIRIHILEEFEQALQFIYGEIEYAAVDIGEIFGSLAVRSRYCGGFWAYMYDRLLENNGGDLNSIGWKPDQQSQLHTLEIFKSRLEGIISAARSEYKGKAKVCHAVGAAAGIFISVLLV